jgi:hypothetical protein
MAKEKARMTVYSPTSIQVDYTVYLPTFLTRPFYTSPPESRRARRESDYRRQAILLAQINHGHSPVELDKPVATYEELLKSLACVPGLVRLCQEDPYRITLNIGGLFEAKEIADKVTRLLFHHFYPNSEFSWLEPVHENSDYH